MKLIKLASLALAAAGIFGVYNAEAATGPIGVTTNSTALTVTITVTTNKADKVSGNKTTYVTMTTKITNKQLLTLFQNWSTNAFSVTKAKIVMGWDEPWNGDVLVVDSTGTNVLFDASDDGNDNQYFVADFDDEDGAATGSETETSYNYTEYNSGDLELVDENVYLPYTYIEPYGASKVTYSENDGSKPSWKLSGMANLPLQGDAYFLDSSEENQGSAGATMKTSGSGKGSNGYWD